MSSSDARPDKQQLREEVRQQARQLADRLQGETLGRGSEFTAWFEQLYAAANGDSNAIPWADEAPHRGLVEWMSGKPAGDGRLAADIGCGIGDNAAFLAASGFDVTAFDLSPSAIAWAKRRFAGGSIDFRVVDLYSLPDDLVGRFDLVHETYTIQALPQPMRPQIYAAIASLLAPGGTLLVICRSREEHVEPAGPPWPLARSELVRFEQLGLIPAGFDSFEEAKPDGRIIPHFRAEYRRAG